MIDGEVAGDRCSSVATSPSSRIAPSRSACPRAALVACSDSAFDSSRARFATIATALDLARERVHLPPLLRRRLRDAAGVLARLARGAADRVERGAASVLRSSTPPTISSPATHLAGDAFHLRPDLAHQVARLPRGVQALRRQVPHLLGHDREPAPFPPGARRLDRAR
jgi:hypothetical protein